VGRRVRSHVGRAVGVRPGAVLSSCLTTPRVNVAWSMPRGAQRLAGVGARRATDNMQRTTCDMQRTTCNGQPVPRHAGSGGRGARRTASAPRRTGGRPRRCRKGISSTRASRRCTSRDTAAIRRAPAATRSGLGGVVSRLRRVVATRATFWHLGARCRPACLRAPRVGYVWNSAAGKGRVG
jgi:hypothetical protein